MKRQIFSIRSLVIYTAVVVFLIFSGTSLAQFLPNQNQLNPLITLVFSSMVIPIALFLFQKDVEQFAIKELEQYKTMLGFRVTDTKRSIEVRDNSWEKFQAIYRDLESFLQPMKFGNSPELLVEADKKLFSRIKESVDEFTKFPFF